MNTIKQRQHFLSLAQEAISNAHLDESDALPIYMEIAALPDMYIKDAIDAIDAERQELKASWTLLGKATLVQVQS